MLRSNDFVTALTKRRAAGTPAPDLKDQCNASPTIRELLSTGPGTGMAAVIEPDGRLRMRFQPIYKKDASGTLLNVLANGSNEELVPLLLGSEYASHFITISKHNRFPRYGVSARTPIPTDAFQGTGYTDTTNIYVGALPRKLDIGHHKEIVEGFIWDQETRDTFKAVYGEDAGKWLEIAHDTMANLGSIHAVINKLKKNGAIEALLGANYANINVVDGDPTVVATSITKGTHPSEYEELRIACGPYVELAAAAAPTGSGAGFAKELAEALESKESKEEKGILKTGHARSMSFWMAGDGSMADGKLTSIALPEPTKKHAEALKLKSVAEQVEEVKLMLDTNNRDRPKHGVDAMASNRKMDNHCVNTVRAIVLGMHSTEPMKALPSKHDKQLKVTLLQFYPLSEEVASKIVVEQNEEEARRARGGLTGDHVLRIHLFVPERITSLPMLKHALANFVSDSDSLWVSTSPTPVAAGNNEKRPIVTRVVVYTFEYVHSTDFEAYWDARTQDEKVIVVVHLVSILDRFLSKWAKAGNEYSMILAIKADDVSTIPFLGYEKALLGVYEQFMEVEKYVRLGRVLDAPSYMCDKIEKPALKKAKTDLPAQPASAPRPAQPAQSAQPAQAPAASWTEGWGRGRGRPQQQQRARLSLEEKKEKGAFHVVAGFAQPIAPSLDKYCVPFQVKGQVCPGCENKRHVPFWKWPQADRSVQYSHVQANLANVKFSDEVKLPDEWKHLKGGSDMVELEESPVDIMARRAIEVFHNSVIGSQVTSNTNVSSSMVRKDERIISTWDGIVDMETDEALDGHADTLGGSFPSAHDSSKRTDSTSIMTSSVLLNRPDTTQDSCLSSGKLIHINPPPTYPTPAELYKEFPQDIQRCYKAQATISTTLFVMIKSRWLDDGAFEGVEIARATLAEVNPDHAALLEYVPKLMKVDFSSLREPWYDYANQTKIDRHRVWLLAACAVHYNLDFGLVMRYMPDETLAKWRDKDRILAAARPVVSDEDYEHMYRILTFGCPAEFNWEEPAENKETFLRRGNHKTIEENPEIVESSVVKEVKNSHVTPFPRFLVVGSPYARTTPQTVVNAEHETKKPRLCFDGSTVLNWWETSINMITPTTNEAQCTFGLVFMAFLVWIWNLRISYPHTEILLAYVDISSCFRWPRIFPCLVGAFGFIIGAYFFAANAMVFGSVVSASSWEPFRRAISGLAESFFGKEELVEKHREYLDMIRWEDEPDENVRFVPAKACSQNKGIRNEDGTERKTPHFIYVDDNLMADVRHRMRFTLAAAIEAIFTIMGFPCLILRQCALALDKWGVLLVSHNQVLLGLVINTRQLTVSISDEYRAETLKLLHTTWANRESFYVGEMEELAGKLGRIGQAFRPIYHCMPNIYASIAFALRGNDGFLLSTDKKYRELVKAAKRMPTNDEDIREINFAMKQAARAKHHSKRRYWLPLSLKEEIIFLRKILQDASIQLSTHIGHLVPRDHAFETAGDSCKMYGGGWSTDLLYIWHLKYPDEVYKRACYKNNKGGRAISINVLEMVVIIINFAAVIFICDHDGIDLSDFPVLLNWCDNIAACAWINYKCKYSLIGRRLARLFVGLLLNTKIGIQADWISTHLNFIADDISRLKQEDADGNFDYEKLRLTYPILRDCRQFQPSEALLGMIWDVLLNNACPDPLTVKQLKPAALGQFIS